LVAPQPKSTTTRQKKPIRLPPPRLSMRSVRLDNSSSSPLTTRNWPPILEEIEREQHFHGPIWRLILSYLGCGGTHLDELKAQLRAEVIPQNTSGRADVVDRYLSDEYLDNEIQNALRFRDSQRRNGRTTVLFSTPK